MINSLWICIVFLETGIYVVCAIPVECVISSNNVTEAGNWPHTVGTYRNDFNWTELNYFRLRCEFSSSNPGTNPQSALYRVYHDHWKRPFEKIDCEHTGCTPVIWNSNSSFSRGDPIIDVYWGSVIRFGTTAPQLKICEINVANLNVILTTSQLNDLTLCQPSGRFSALGSNENSSIVVKDFFMHVSSDMLTEQEIERVNNKENVITTINKDCSAGYRFRDGCDITILASPFSDCKIFFSNHYYTARSHRGLEVTKISNQANRVIAYKFRITTYKLYYYAHSNLRKGKFFYNSRVLHRRKPVELVLTCENFKLHTTLSKPFVQAFRDRIVKKFSIATLYWPTITFTAEVGEKYNTGRDHFFISNNQEVVINATIVSSNNVTDFQVTEKTQHPKNAKVVLKTQIYDPHNHATTYVIAVPSYPYLHNTYNIFYRVNEIDLKLHDAFYLTITNEIEMAINPMKIVVVRGDRSAHPFFVCAASAFPIGMTIVWSKEIGRLKAQQAPVQRELLDPGTFGTYLQFPPATDLTSDYNGEYTCTVSTEYLGTKKLTAIVVVLEPGSYYGLFHNNWIPVNPGPGDVIVTEQEKSLFDCIDRPVITEPGKLSCTKRKEEGAFVSVMIGISTSVLTIAATLLGIILIYRWYKKRHQLPRDNTSSKETLELTTSSNTTTTESIYNME